MLRMNSKPKPSAKSQIIRHLHDPPFIGTAPLQDVVEIANKAELLGQK